MRIAVFILIGVLVLGGLVGMLVYRSGQEGEEDEFFGGESPEMVELKESEEIRMDGVGSQFIQEAPADSPPEEGLLSGEEETGLVTSGSPATEPVAGEVVSITDLGFSPETVNVSVGTRVTFINNGQAMHWPASDAHPTHGELPGFDAGHGLSTGEEYAFVFLQAGEWGYHDHLNTQLTGVVVVK